MNKFIEILNKKIKDQTAAFAILGAMIITFTITIGAFEYINYNKLAEASTDIDMAEEWINSKEANIMETNEILTNSIINTEEAKKKNEEEYEKLKKNNKISSAADKYYIKVNYGAQVATVYTKDSNGKYTKPVRAMVCSTGRATPTSGTYRTLGKGNWWPLMGDVYGQYSTHITGDILFHSVPYLESGNKSSLEWWAYDQLGKRVSAGCVRLTVADAKWIYDNCVIGTQVEFYSSSNPGPLGKPTTRKISNAPNYVKGWDPTDPDKNNPWSKYLKGQENKKDENNTITNTTTDKDNNTVGNNTTDNNTIGNNTIGNNTIGNNTIENTTKDEENKEDNTNVVEKNDIVNKVEENNISNENIVEDSIGKENLTNDANIKENVATI